MTTEPTEEETRRLLARAAATIDVDESAPLTLTGLPEPGRRRWSVVLAAAAAVVVAIGGGLLVAQELGTERVDSHPPTAGQPTTAPVDGEVVLGEDQVPGLIGYTRVEATQLLEGRGYKVEIRRQPDGCNTAGIVTGSSPPVGARVDPGDTVTIRVIRPRPVVDCVGEGPWEPVWDLVRHARGLSADSDNLGEAGVTREALATIAHMVTRPWPDHASPRLQAAWSLPAGCFGHDERSWDLWMWVEVPVDGIFCPAPLLGLRLDGGDIAAVGVDDAATPPSDITEEELAASLERLSAADQFVAWARGDGPAPDFADRVRLLSPGFHPGWVDEPEDRSRYAGCSGLGFPDCGIDPVAAVFRAEGRVAADPGRPHCGFDGAYPSRYVEADEVHLVVADAEPGRCPALVQLWITAGGEIYRLAQVGLPPG